MKKIGIILFLLTLTLTSCSNDDDNSNFTTGLIGSWEYAYTEDGASVVELITFNANNSGTHVLTTSLLGETITETGNFTWSVNGNNLIVKSEGESGNFTVPFSISGNKLTITFIDGETIVYTRK